MIGSRTSDNSVVLPPNRKVATTLRNHLYVGSVKTNAIASLPPVQSRARQEDFPRASWAVRAMNEDARDVDSFLCTSNGIVQDLNSIGESYLAERSPYSPVTSHQWVCGAPHKRMSLTPLPGWSRTPESCIRGRSWNPDTSTGYEAGFWRFNVSGFQLRPQTQLSGVLLVMSV